MERIQPFIEKEQGIPSEVKDSKNETLKGILESIRVYLDRLSQAPPYIEEFFKNDVPLENEEARQTGSTEEAKKVILTFKTLLANKKPKASEEFKAIMEETGKETGQKGKNLYMPIRVATTGKIHGLELPVLFPLLGHEKLLLRIERLEKDLGILA
jgi:glutamyl-tRNA synthetase/nondiscriminating glutamyl-tRNA synthetase